MPPPASDEWGAMTEVDLEEREGLDWGMVGRAMRYLPLLTKLSLQSE